MIKPESLEEHPEFSLVLGGPLFKFYRRAYLSGDALELVRRRVLVIAGAMTEYNPDSTWSLVRD